MSKGSLKSREQGTHHYEICSNTYKLLKKPSALVMKLFNNSRESCLKLKLLL